MLRIGTRGKMLLLLFVQDIYCYFLFDFLGDFVQYYEKMFFPDTTGAWLILVGSVLITFYGLYYPRISLTPYITAMIYYNFLDIQQQLDAIPTRKAEEFAIPPDILQGFKNFFNQAADNPVHLIAISFVGSCLLVWAIELAQNLLFMVGLYIIYSMFFNIGFERYRETDPVLFYISLFVTFLILYHFTKRISSYVFVVLFSVTGSFVLLSSVELISETEMGFYGLISDLKNMHELDFSVTTPMIVWAGVAFIGMFWQWRFVEGKS